MTDTISLSTLRTNVRQRADMVSSLFVTDAELNGYIQASYKELYDILVDAVEDYNLSTSTLTISSGSTFPLPTDFYKLRGIDDLQDTSNPRTVRKFMLSERNDYLLIDRVALATEFSDVVYRLTGSTVQILPVDSAKRTYKIWYVPLPTVPAADGDTIDAINGFDEYVTVDAAIKCKLKEESNVTDLTRAKAALYERITRMKSNRDENLPDKVSRVRNKRLNGRQSYLMDV